MTGTSRTVNGYLIERPRGLFGWLTLRGARATLAARRGFAVWFSSDLGWYLKRGDKIFGRRGAVRPRKGL